MLTSDELSERVFVRKQGYNEMGKKEFLDLYKKAAVGQKLLEPDLEDALDCYDDYKIACAVLGEETKASFEPLDGKKLDAIFYVP